MNLNLNYLSISDFDWKLPLIKLETTTPPPDVKLEFDLSAPLIPLATTTQIPDVSPSLNVSSPSLSTSTQTPTWQLLHKFGRNSSTQLTDNLGYFYNIKVNIKLSFHQ